MMIRTIDPKLRKQIDDDLNRIKALESTNAALLEAFRTLADWVILADDEGELERGPVGRRLLSCATEAIRKAKEK